MPSTLRNSALTNNMIKNLILKCSLLLMPLGFLSCSEDAVKMNRSSGYEDFVSNYNDYISEWLEEQLITIDENKLELEKKIAVAASPEVKAALEKELESVVRSRAKYQNRVDQKEFFSVKTEADIPADLVWENGMDNPTIGDPRAKKGGILHNYIPDFPRTLRPIGPQSNSSFRGELYDNIDVSLVNYHPITKNFIPGLAKEWAIGADGRTVYYKLDPDATYDDGVQVKSNDFLFGLFIRLSDNIAAPYEQQYYKEQFSNVTMFTDSIFSISLPEAKPLLPYFTNITPAPPHFYNEYGPDYEERYQWRIPPTTGAYTVLPEDIKKGRSITLTRVKDWWAKDKKFFKYSNNVDKISYQVIADESKAFELFRLGKIDTFLLGSPEKWYDKMEIDEYFDGYIAKSQFYNVYPRVPRGMYLNVHKAPLNDINVRKGIAHALNFDKVNTILFYGDADRLEQFSEGFEEFSKPGIRARRFSITKAKEYFAKAGYVKSDREGYLVNNRGKRLKVELSWATHPLNDRMMALLQEEAKKAGLEILLDGQQQMVNFKKIVEKRHQIAYSGWGVTPPFPRYYQFFHSENAYDANGNVKQQTNNINSYSDPEMDRLCEIVRGAETLEELREASHKVQQIVHDEAIFIPALNTGYVRMAYWKWMKFPQTKLYEFSTPQVYIPIESYLYWIDVAEQTKMMKALKNNEKFPETNELHDLYRNGVPPLEELEKRELPNTPQPSK